MDEPARGDGGISIRLDRDVSRGRGSGNTNGVSLDAGARRGALSEQERGEGRETEGGEEGFHGWMGGLNSAS